MIRLHITKQNGSSDPVHRRVDGPPEGEKGLVGPNSADKTTLFRMISTSAVAAVMDGVGPVSDLAVEIAQLEAAMAEPEQADNVDALVERYGEVQG